MVRILMVNSYVTGQLCYGETCVVGTYENESTFLLMSEVWSVVTECCLYSGGGGGRMSA